jgi:hypothetical protein
VSRLLFHAGHEIGHIGATEEIRIDDVLAEIDEVAVGVDEAGQERLSAGRKKVSGTFFLMEAGGRFAADDARPPGGEHGGFAPG